MDETLKKINRTQDWFKLVLWILSSGPTKHQVAVAGKDPKTTQVALATEYLTKLQMVLNKVIQDLSTTVLENYSPIVKDALQLISWSKKNRVFDATWEMPLQLISLECPTLTMPSTNQLLLQSFQEVVNSAWTHLETSNFGQQKDVATGSSVCTQKERQTTSIEPTFTSFTVAVPTKNLIENAGMCKWCEKKMLDTNAPKRFALSYCNTYHK